MNTALFQFIRLQRPIIYAKYDHFIYYSYMPYIVPNVNTTHNP